MGKGINVHVIKITSFFHLLICIYKACKYTCHRKCQERVLTTCITNPSTASTSDDQHPIRHRIPHRFEPTSTLSANWCAHCGYMLPFGKNRSLKCTECSSMAHKDCGHLVPDFCGLKIEVIAQLLSTMSAVQRVQKEKSLGKLVEKEEKKKEEVFSSFQNLNEERVGVDKVDHPSTSVVVSQQQQHKKPGNIPPVKIGLSDFNFLAVLGKGNFGKVKIKINQTHHSSPISISLFQFPN